MNLLLFWKGLLIGFSIAAPVGPIGVLCIRRSIAEGRLSGFVSGLGAASADAVYGTVAALGLTWIAGFLVDQQMWIRLLGGLFLCYLAVATFAARVSQSAEVQRSQGSLAAFVSTFFLTLTNPLTILSFAAIFAGLGLSAVVGGYLPGALLVTGVFLGSTLWWMLLSGGASLLGPRLGAGGLVWVNRFSGVIIGGFGLAALGSLL
ncbi:MAG: LysE family transporter [Chloroflexi bacterium]|nr:LysE family transporter [Chloroflexota bacterium]